MMLDEILTDIGMKAKIEKVQKRKYTEEETEQMWMKLENKKQKRDVWKKKKNLRELWRT